MNELFFFAELREKMGEELLKRDVSGMTVQDVKKVLIDEYELSKINEAMVAINEEFASSTTVVREGDIVAFIPPVSGG
ncbi:molybdopterin converting factor subunit 1 [Halobacillus yeomjeoni]|uniref:Molybdopterin synthase sulfur carrier subunit n=1 Tax=Halobacillus yeomjeoni TaxID=311194 RepID=A0A931HSG1_9BACI|nr:molybdopterin converting factor subunit 1 [Halobacillus yeomjeoni]MBH0228775.1 molybdopterin converting factor subunit 1 [Halobacillus yeomjeoni]